MNMSKIRKKLQDKLRRKYHWSTNTNYNRGCNLIKEGAVRHLLHKENKWAIDLAICHDDLRIRDSLSNKNPEYEIQMWLTREKLLDDGGWKTIEQIPLYFSFEEFELLYQNMKDIWNSFDENDKPEWLTMEEILEFARKIGAE